MNNTIIDNQTQTLSLDFTSASYVNPIIVIRFYQIGFPITFLLGFIGNFASLMTFSRSSLRKVSTSCLFIALTISDSLVLCMYIIDFVEFGLQIRLYEKINYDELCRFHSFIKNVFQVLSSWILVEISLDRWIRTRFPYKSGSICTPKNASLVGSILLVLCIGLHAHLLTSLYGMFIPNLAVFACGPTIYGGSYFYFYYFNWYIIQIIILCLLPAILMLILLVDTIICIHIHKRIVIHPDHPIHDLRRLHHQKHVQIQMFILTLTSIIMFLLTILPVSIYKIIAVRQPIIGTTIFTVISIWTAFQWIQSLNYAMHFYSHCLTSTLFRKEFKQQMKSFLGNRQIQPNEVKLTAERHGTRNHVY